jgi:hypothetical protein
VGSDGVYSACTPLSGPPRTRSHTPVIRAVVTSHTHTRSTSLRRLWPRGAQTAPMSAPSPSSIRATRRGSVSRRRACARCARLLCFEDSPCVPSPACSPQEKCSASLCSRTSKLMRTDPALLPPPPPGAVGRRSLPDERVHQRAPLCLLSQGVRSEELGVFFFRSSSDSLS